ncbi:ABC transporter permease [Corynebacterium endometrii]|uniref:ABC transporter permease n=1 Tax=Corynebacterium endometrii TaxID=2488819 RepID=UPI00109D678C|nr:ABC transporter permease [Corynebacterium endometrii]
MFLAIREINHARGRFALMVGVLGLITVLLIMLTGLTNGLGKQNTSALEALGPHSVVFKGEDASFTESAMDADDRRAFPGAVPLGVSQTRAESSQAAAGVAVFGLPAGTASPVGGIPGEGVLVPEETARDLGLAPGAEINLGGNRLTVAGVVPGLEYSHSPVVWVSTQAWRAVAHAPEGTNGTVLISNEELSEAAGYTVTDLPGSFEGLASYSSERGSLQAIQGFLYAISALVTVAFLAVWTIQRTRELAVLKALGASGKYLLRDSLAQAAIVLGVGAVGGMLVGLGLGALASGALPFELDWASVVAPAVGIFILGMGGALLATRKVAATNPLLAMGGIA